VHSYVLKLAAIFGRWDFPPNHEGADAKATEEPASDNDKK
jgi:hypothetical protein